MRTKFTARQEVALATFVDNHLPKDVRKSWFKTHFGQTARDSCSGCKAPIIIEEEKMQVGYNEDEIRTFIPRRLREIIMCTTCAQGDDCDYKNALDIYFKELREKQQSA